MAITMQDIQNEGFEHSLRGYDVEQVDVFLERVANEVDAMNKQIAELEENLKTANEELENARGELVAASAAAIEANEEPKASLREQELEAELEVMKQRIEDATKRADEAEAAVEPLKEQLEEKNKMDSAIAEAFIAAQKSANKIKEDARIEGERIYQESEAKAREFIRESLANREALNKEIETLQASAKKFRDEYLSMLERFSAQAQTEFQNLPELSIVDLPGEENVPEEQKTESAPAEEKE